MAMDYELVDRGSIHGKGKIFLFSTASRSVLGSTQPHMRWIVGTIFQGVKEPGREADHSPTSSVEIKNVGGTPELPHMSSCRGDLSSNHKDNFTFFDGVLINHRGSWYNTI
jgi:hypothetical protein